MQQHPKHEVLDVLRNAGLQELAQEAAMELPDPVESEQLFDWLFQHGVTHDVLISRFGGSP